MTELIQRVRHNRSGSEEESERQNMARR